MTPTKEDLHELGYITKLHGYKGEFTAYLDTESLVDYNDLEGLFLEVKGQMIPYIIESIGGKTNKTMKLKLEGIDSEEAAKPLVKSRIFIPKQELSERDEARIELRSIEGYKVFDAAKGEIGVVSGILELPANPQLQILSGAITILLPLREEFIRQIDKEKKEVHIEAPEGLIDLYLG